MKTIIAGSRNLTDTVTILNLIKGIVEKYKIEITEIVSGGAKGIDKIGEMYAEINNIPLTIFKANWNKNGKKAGFIRNEEMSKYGEILIAIWDGESTGTKHMIDCAKKEKLIIYICYMKGQKYDDIPF